MCRFLDLRNAANVNAIQNVTASSGKWWLRPIDIGSLRGVRIGAKFDW